MPQVIDNADGTKTLTINSGELRVLRNWLVRQVPDVKRVLQLVDSPDVRATLDFLKSGLA